ncbi:UDP-N-acetylmuramoyl-L-alanyl-D-glutamate--2,6-diaminopimelate ligase [Rodentibacter caecimuris]|uniref:UDP-N-acetylmuramoyl-L-alanyl-D-glutamate--2,6-diaminopimelate ligase n=1 Tax=Rodentibacter caecimuris TaxID=1796644 RepID=A0ABX3KXQ5_9PAST|nr:UDP-N-acetylmuramoyl-L-alanyl-D-glutamate--2,6-diaminopimelate ligase [Rodentibacter heylii]
MKKLTALFNLPISLADIEVNDMQSDSRKVKKNDLFVALKGHQVDGNRFISQAIASGAVAVLSETEDRDEHLTIHYIQDTPIIKFYQLSIHLSELAGRFYDNPTQKLALVGVTGTNGKTTVTQLISQWAQLLGKKSAVMGTIGNGLYGQLESSTNTTGSPIDIQSALADFVKQNVNITAIEVSSHGLVQHRVDGLIFKVAVFTNLSRDHLDYHHSMQEYANAKKRLFSTLKSGNQILNADDSIGRQWLDNLPDAVVVSCRADFQPTHNKWLKATNVEFVPDGVIIDIQSCWGTGTFHSPLLGEFNVSNVLLAAATLLTLGYSLTDLTTSVSRLKGVCGRMEVIQKINKPLVIVDYAHTPDALEKALQAARGHCKGKLWCIFGCGGKRDSGKRPLMARAAEQYADMVIVTQDNPRTESPDKIESDIMNGFSRLDKVGVIPDREEAIFFAIDNASASDVIVIAGKGHEDYQIIGTETHHFSDQEIAQKYLQ